MLTQLIHNGILIPSPPEPVGLALTVRGRVLQLTPKQEEMALAWARKKDTEYVQDPVFVANFLLDFSRALGIEPPLAPDEVDWSPAYELVDEERRAKERLTPEERKARAAARKAEREELKAKFGHAIVNGQRVELGAYIAEPSGIFMGRGQHPLRGRWKEGARQKDVTLNLSPDAPRPEGDWGEIVWQPDCMWVARWEDKLSGKLKYVWLSDAAPIKQQREAQKFDKAVALSREIQRVRAKINEDLSHSDPQVRKIATACYLIDALCLRVGDEKDPEEADTVGATTLRPEHVTIRKNGVVEFRFLGKDSVEWHKQLEPPEIVLDNLRELIANARPSSTGNGNGPHPTRDLPQIFPDITSRDVNAYLSGILPGLTAKVFRTHHATVAVQTSLDHCGVAAADPEYIKWEAASLANLEAAILCNHTKKATGNWAERRKRYRERMDKARERIRRYDEQLRELREALAALRAEAKEKEEAATPEAAEKVRERYRKRIATLSRRIEAVRERKKRAEEALGKIRAQEAIAKEKRNWNLGTSLKSYIDPRVYYQWGKEVDYDVLDKYYPTTLRRKFFWVRAMDQDPSADSASIVVRPCMRSDSEAVAALFGAVKEEFPEIPLPLQPQAIEERYLPSLDKPWRESLIALDQDERILAFATIGPEWAGDGEDVLDLMVITHPGYTSEPLVLALTERLRASLMAYNLQRPRKPLVWRPRDESWIEVAPGVAEALGLLQGDLEEEEE